MGKYRGDIHIQTLYGHINLLNKSARWAQGVSHTILNILPSAGRPSKSTHCYRFPRFSTERLMLLTGTFPGHPVIGWLRNCKEKCSEVHCIRGKNQPLCNPAYHIAVTFKLIMEFKSQMEFTNLFYYTSYCQQIRY